MHPILFVISIISVILFSVLYLRSGGDWEQAQEIYTNIVVFLNQAQLLEAVLTLIVLAGSFCLLILVFYGLLCVAKSGIGKIDITDASDLFTLRMQGIIKSITIVTVGTIDTVLKSVAFVPTFFASLIDLLLVDEATANSGTPPSNPASPQSLGANTAQVTQEVSANE